MSESESSTTRYIRLRGLPWSVTNQEILDFLKGVNVVNGEKGIHLVTNRWDGKNTGEAFVELESENDEEEAFKHNKESLGHRYIEIFSASNEEAEFAIKKPGQTSNVVKLRGLPYAVNEDMIEEFFDGLEIKPDREGMLIVMDRRGRATGEAYVHFETQDDTEKALKLNREKIGHRYIEIFRSSPGEMRRASSGGRPGPYDKKDRGGRGSDSDFGGLGNNRNRPREIWANNNFGNNNGNGGGFGGGFNNGGGGGFNGGGRFNNNGGGGGGGGFGGGNNNNGGGGGGFGDFNNFGNNRNNNFNNDDDFCGGGGNFGNMNRNNMGGGNNGGGGFGNGGGGGFGNGGGGGFFGGNNGGGMNNNSNMGGSFGPIGGGRNDDLFCIHMRGLPYYCYETDVNRFFEPLCPVNVNIIYNKRGLHSGSADAYFESHDEAVLAMKKHREQMGSRYIELFYDGKSKKDGFRRL